MGDAGEDSIEAWLESRPSDGGGYGRLRCGTCVGEWHVEAYLGAGVSSEVYRVRHLNLSYEGALKLLVNDAKNLKERFLAEIDAIRFLSLPSLPRFFGAGTFGAMPFYVMEYLLPLPDPMPRGDVPGFLNKVAKAVQTLHEAGFVHRDLKPGNIMLRRNGDPVLIDLGLVKPRGKEHTPLGWKPRQVSIVDGKPVGVGTIDFAAPEQLLEGKSLVQGDVFSLGKIAWYLYEENPPRAMRSIIHRATREIPKERYESAQAFAAAVRRRNRRSVVLLLLAALGVAAVAVAVAFRSEIKMRVVNWLVPPTVVQATPPPEETSPDEETPPAPVDPAEEIQRHADETEQVYFDRIMPFAEKGDVPAQVKVAEALFYGRGTATNRAAAVEWYRKAAVAGDGSAQASLGYCLLNGLGCEARKDEAAVWYAKGAAQDDPNAINGLAFCYLHGFGVEKDEKRGFELAMKAAVRGHAPSQTLVGECFLEGRGVARDQERGEAWLYRATRQNNKRAENLLQVY